MECIQTQHNFSRASIETRLDGYVLTSDVSLCNLNKHVPYRCYMGLLPLLNEKIAETCHLFGYHSTIVFPEMLGCFYTLSSVCLGICEPGNRAKTIDPRSPERGGLGSIENEPWSGLVVVRNQSDLTEQRTRLYHNV